MNLRQFDVSSEIKLRLLLAVALIVLAVSSRLAPHPANFAPIAAVALFAGAILPRKWALSLPLLCMIASDLLIGLHPLILYTWGSFVLIALFGHRFLKTIKPAAVAGASLGASVLFYLVSNLGVFLEGRLYPMTIDGLLSCYYNALPFFRNTLLGDLVFTGLLFGSYALVHKLALTHIKPVSATP